MLETTMPKATSKRRPSGPSGQHNPDLKQKLIRELEPGQFETWEDAARRAGLRLTDWIRTRCDAAAKREK